MSARLVGGASSRHLAPLAAPRAITHLSTRASHARRAPATPAPLKSTNVGPTKPLGLPYLPDRRSVASPVRATAAGSDEPLVPEPPSGDTVLGVAKETWAKVIPLAAMFFLILFNYTILRDTKDVLVVTAPGSGAEVIPFLKTYVMLPASITMAVVYAKLTDLLSPESTFYACLFPFLAFFGAFAFILYPARDTIHPHAFCDWLQDLAGPRAAGPIAVVRYWSYSAFYMMAQLWGSIVVSVLFWGFANQVTTMDEAKQFYPFFGLGANVALIFSGAAVTYFSNIRATLPPGVDGWGVSLNGLMSLVVASGCAIAGIYYYMNRRVVKSPLAASKKKKKKSNMSIGESVRFLAGSSYIRNLATLVVCYGVAINVVEVTWKAKIKEQFPNPNDYSSFMGTFSSCTGAVTLVMMLVGRAIFRKYGWGTAAIITPAVILATGIGFFGLILLQGPLTPATTALGLTPLMACVLVGAAQNIFSKASKYSLFDPCKEMAFIPLDAETRNKGKAAIDVVCNPLGKSGGSLIQQAMIVTFGSLGASTPYLGAVLGLIIIAWLGAAKSLAVEVEEKTRADIEAKLQEAQEVDNMQSPVMQASVNEDGFIDGKMVESTDEKPKPDAPTPSAA